MMRSLFGQAEMPLVERRTIRLADQDVSYTLKRSSKRRSIGLRIDDDGLTVSMPLRASERWLHSVLQEKGAWITEKLAGWQSQRPAPQIWRDGEGIALLGETLALRVVPSLFEAPPMVRARQLYVHVTSEAGPEQVERVATQWYKQEAEQLFRERVAHFAPMLGVAPSGLKLSSARTQWGSCNARGVIHLNWHLIKLSMRLVDYVVVHELAHLVELNHSAAFWAVVKTACPDFKKRRDELRRHGIMA